MFIMILKAIVLGIVEGITEFLPISSTGHLIIVEQFIKLSSNKSFTDSFDVIIQLGAILSVVVLFWNKLWPFSGTNKEKRAKWILWSKVLCAFMPAAVLGLLFEKTIKAKLFNPITVAVALAVYGLVLILIEGHNKNKKFAINDIKLLSYKTAFFIGLFQCLAMVPGTSRSAATIIGAMILGLSRSEAAEFSFFLAIPTMVAASGHDILKHGLSFSGSQWIIVAVGFIVSFIVALGVIKVFISYIKEKDFKVFGYYRIVLGAIVILLAILGVIK
jgi:undecaprenyl-diphosphatase